MSVLADNDSASCGLDIYPPRAPPGRRLARCALLATASLPPSSIHRVNDAVGPSPRRRGAAPHGPGSHRGRCAASAPFCFGSRYTRKKERWRWRGRGGGHQPPGASSARPVSLEVAPRAALCGPVLRTRAFPLEARPFLCLRARRDVLFAIGDVPLTHTGDCRPCRSQDKHARMAISPTSILTTPTSAGPPLTPPPPEQLLRTRAGNGAH